MQLHSNTCAIPLHNGMFATVDAEDYDFIRSFRWGVNSGYASRGCTRWGKLSTMKMHRLILLPDPDMLVDHINGDKLDNRKENLRQVDTLQNSWNAKPYTGTRSKYKGVCIRNRTAGRPMWTARISIGGTPMYIGDFDDEIDAALAYDMAAIERRGRYARTNFLFP